MIASCISEAKEHFLKIAYNQTFCFFFAKVVDTIFSNYVQGIILLIAFKPYINYNVAIEAREILKPLNRPKPSEYKESLIYTETRTPMIMRMVIPY